ncbi:MAG: DNA/RNA nuclease SfsA [Pseudomonadota bacterium]
MTDKQDAVLPFDGPLIEGRLVQRYKRFLADVELADGKVITVHCPNPGAMLGIKDPGLRVWILDSGNPKRKLRYTLEVIEADGGLIGINTNRPNKLAERAIINGLVPELTIAPGHSLRREVKYGKNSRIDLLIEKDGQPEAPQTFIEIKNVHLLRPEARPQKMAEFPDSITSRGSKHLVELSDQVAAGHRAVMLYVIQRMDCLRFGIASDIDQAYGKAFVAAQAAGVEALAYDCHIDLSGIVLANKLEIPPVVL